MSGIKELIVNTKFLDEIKQPIFVKNEQGLYLYCNESFSKFVGVSVNKIINCTAFDIAPHSLAKIYTDADKLLFESSGNQQYLSKVKNQIDSSEAKVIFDKTVIRNEQGGISGFIGTINTHHVLIHDDHSIVEKLTERELETLNLLAQGRSVKKIANLLMISPHTVTDYMKSIYLKLDVHSKNEAIYKALAFWSSKPE